MNTFVFDAIIDPLLRGISSRLCNDRCARASLGSISSEQREVLQQFLRLVISSDEWTKRYSSELLRRHRSAGSYLNPFWCEVESDTDFDTLIQPGIEHLSDVDLVALAVRPSAVWVAHDCLMESLHFGLPVADEWMAMLSLDNRSRVEHGKRICLSEEALQARCRKCGTELAFGDDTCSYCGYCELNEYFATVLTDDCDTQALLVDDWGASLASS